MDVPTTAELIASIETFLAQQGIAETRFGREATGEPQLLASLRKGRSPSLDTANRISAYMARKRAERDHGGKHAPDGDPVAPGTSVDLSERVPA